MKHEEASKLLNDYVDSCLSGAERLEFEDHLQGCAVCSSEVKQIRALLEMTDSLPENVAPSRDLWPGVSAAIEQTFEHDVAQIEREADETHRQQPPAVFDGIRERVRSFRIRRFSRVPALAIAALAVLLIVLWNPKWSKERNLAVESGETLEGKFSDIYAQAMIDALEAESRQADIELKLFSTLARGSGSPSIPDLMLEELDTVDQAIAEVIEAWKSDIGNPKLTRRLVASLHTQAALQRRIIEITTRS